MDITQCSVDDMGWLYAQTRLGWGLVHTQDVAIASEAIEQGRWTLGTVQREGMAHAHGYVISPQSAQAIKKPVV